MRHHLPALAIAATLILAALLVWLWRSDTILIRECANAGGNWDASTRTCLLRLNQSPTATASLRR
jgi:hypothetical protein